MKYKDLCYSCTFADECPVPPDTDEASRYSLLKNMGFFGAKPEDSPVLTKIITECPKYICDKIRVS